MAIGDDTYVYRRRLPHLEKAHKWYFVTWVTKNRKILPADARDIALRCCVYEHLKTYWLESVVIMPDHVHLVAASYEDQLLRTIIDRIKSVSAHVIARATGRHRVWQREYVDRILRSDEDHRKKGEYVSNVDDYPWIWRSRVEGAKSAAESAALH